MDTSEAFSLLADLERQYVLLELFEGPKTTTVERLSHQVAARAHAESYTDVESIKTRLVHNHLPRLSNHGVIEYDRSAGHIEFTDVGKEFKSTLDVANTGEIPPP